MPTAYRRYKVLYGVEVWIHPSADATKVIQFRRKQFAPAPHANVLLCQNEGMAEKIVKVIRPISERLTEEDARGASRD